MTCPDCGASNPSNARWCNLCARPFDGSAVTTADPEPAAAPEVPVPPNRTTAKVWTCPACDSANPVDADACATCGTSIFDAHGRAESEGVDRSLAERRRWVPGPGHVALGDTPTGAMIVAVVLLGAVFAFLLGFWGGLVGAATACAVVAVATWVAGGVDVGARLEGGSPLLTPNRLLVPALAIVLVVIFAASGATGG